MHPNHHPDHHATHGTRATHAIGRAIAATLALAAAVAVPSGAAFAGGDHGGDHGDHGDHGTGFAVVASGVDNPRGLTTLPDGRLVVGEAGHAGDQCFPGNPEDPEGETCVGFTGRVSTVDPRSGAVTPIATGFMSAGNGPIATAGVAGVATKGRTVLTILGASPQGIPPADICAGDTTCLSVLDGARAQVGKLVRIRRDGTWQGIADVGATNYDYIVANKATLDPDNPDFQPGDANPYAITTGAHGTFAVDGGSNTLDRVSPSGRIDVLAYLPNPPGPVDQRFPYDAVPTCVASTGHGLVIGDLAGRLWTWSHGALTQVSLPDGTLHSTNGCAVDRDGNVYVVDMFTGFDPTFGFAPGTGSVVRVDTHGHADTIATGLNLPSGIAIGRDGSIYVGNNAVCPADVTGLPPQVCPAPGEIVRLDRRARDD